MCIYYYYYYYYHHHIIVSGVHHECENKKHHVTVFQKCLIITCRGKILATRPKPTLRVVCVWLNTSNPP